MLERIEGLPHGIEGIQARGTVSKEDYEQVVEPILDAARSQGRRLRFLYVLGPDLHGFTPAAAWEDTKIGLETMHVFDGCAVLSDAGFVRESVRLIGFFMPYPVRAFDLQAREQAIAWLRLLPETPGFSHRLLPEPGVIVVEVKEALGAADFEALARTADSWIATHDQLQGLVIHARRFPGWRNFGSLRRHLRFVREHRRKVRRIGLAADGKLATVAPRIAKRLVPAEVKGFPFSALQQAIAWAAGGATR